MSKLNSGKASIAVFILSLLLGAFFLGKAVTKVLATVGPSVSIDNVNLACGVTQYNFVGSVNYTDNDTHKDFQFDVTLDGNNVLHKEDINNPSDFAGSWSTGNKSFSLGSHTLVGTLQERDENTRTVYDSCPTNYTVYSSDSTKCRKNTGQHDIIDRPSHQEYTGTWGSWYTIASSTKSFNATSCVTPVDVIVCHKDGQSGNYSKVDVSIHSVSDFTGTNGHGNHSEDIWRPFVFDGANFAGQGDYNNFDFDTCDPIETPPTPIYGCMDRKANNFNPNATEQGDVVCTYDSHPYCSDGQTIEVPDNQTPPDGATAGECNGVQCPTNSTYNTDRKVCVCNSGFHQVQGEEDSFTCAADPSTPPVVDLCTNIDGIQTSVPDGMHINATGHECVNYELGGPPQSQGGPSTQVLGASTSTGGQVLGASTMAKTGGFEEAAYQAIMVAGATLSAFGLKNFKKASKKA